MHTTQEPSADARRSSARTEREILIGNGAAMDAYGKQVEAGAARMIQRQSPSHSQSAAAARLAVIFDYMMLHLSEPMKIATLSAMAGLSTSRFFALFKSATGGPPLNWFIRARIKLAGELLERSNLQIKEIAGQVGYDDQFYFSRLFKSMRGISPSAYRTQKQKKPTGIDAASKLPAAQVSQSGR